MDIERDHHFMGFIFDSDGFGSILSHLSASIVFFVKKLSVSPMVPAHERREVLKRFKGIDFMAVVAHQANGMDRIGLFDEFFI